MITVPPLQRNPGWGACRARTPSSSRTAVELVKHEHQQASPSRQQPRRVGPIGGGTCSATAVVPVQGLRGQQLRRQRAARAQAARSLRNEASEHFWAAEADVLPDGEVPGSPSVPGEPGQRRTAGPKNSPLQLAAVGPCTRPEVGYKRPAMTLSGWSCRAIDHDGRRDRASTEGDVHPRPRPGSRRSAWSPK